MIYLDDMDLPLSLSGPWWHGHVIVFVSFFIPRACICLWLCLVDMDLSIFFVSVLIPWTCHCLYLRLYTMDLLLSFPALMTWACHCLFLCLDDMGLSFSLSLPWWHGHVIVLVSVLISILFKCNFDWYTLNIKHVVSRRIWNT